ncbi:ketopantoate reductase family protein [Alicyclobacillus fastidiosus]|uniref:Ketopantoate reductase family protein n=1 Tax=Alicyclobacillus fastidiosus TaxID=392011 RepID=A0ABY6ZF15_9BACL|nr:ketopantoate reductase family protein [Alicyclobacillus fastidiosus]WAH41427.1 ketopantoate reductase family protein [Alicyclobacillus fastidiosus]GMA63052.1 hypothetical protein GCM10025859_34920 [Alicyclobacillus fastidiosus]
MKYNDFPAVLPILANNQSSNIVLVGNNADAHGMQNFLEEKSLVKKNVVFGFQLSGGRKEENGRIICVRGVGKMVLGSLNGNIPFKPLLENAFEHTKYQLAYHDDIDAWLKSHIILIVPLNAASFIQNGNLKEVAKNNELLKQIISAMDEGFTVLEQLGYSVTPASLVNFIRKHRLGRYIVFKIYHNSPFVKLVDGSFGEIVALYDSFDKLKQKSTLLTANWDKLKKQSTSKFIGEK